MEEDKDLTDWKQFLSTLEHLKNVPHGFISLQDFARRADTTYQVLRYQILNGKIPKEHCICVYIMHSDHLYIDWNSYGYDYIMQKNPEKRPKDFEINAEKKYRYIPELPEDHEKTNSLVMMKNEQKKENMENKEEPKPFYEAVVDLPSAKFRVEQLKISKMELEQQKLKNDLVSMRDVLFFIRALGNELKAILQSSENRIAPDLLNCKSVNEVRNLLQEHHRTVIDLLSENMENRIKEEISE